MSSRERFVRRFRPGDFEPGEHLVEDQLAAALRVSRQPVREAFRRLESDGLLTQMPQCGAIVRR